MRLGDADHFLFTPSWMRSHPVCRPSPQEPCSFQPSDASSLWSSNPLLLNQNPHPQVQCSDAQRQNIYHNFMQELATGGGGGTERTAPPPEEEEAEQLEALIQQEQGVVRRAGWLRFKALLTLSRDRKLEPAGRRRWRRYWVTLKGTERRVGPAPAPAHEPPSNWSCLCPPGCTLLFYDTYGRNGGAEQELSPRYALPAADGVVQAVPEHPKKEHVFCLSNRCGDVYLLQVLASPTFTPDPPPACSSNLSYLAGHQPDGPGELGDVHPLGLRLPAGQAPGEGGHAAPPPLPDPVAAAQDRPGREDEEDGGAAAVGHQGAEEQEGGGEPGRPVPEVSGPDE